MSAPNSDIIALVRAAPCASEPLIQLVNAHPELGFRLLRDCPALAVLIVRNYNSTRHGERGAYFRAVVPLPWREHLRLFGLPVLPRTRRILGLLPIAHCHQETVDKLWRVLRSRNNRWLHVVPHLPRL